MLLDSSQNSALLKLIVDGDSQDSRSDLGHNVGSSVVVRDTTVVEGHDRHSGVEVTAGDGAAQERQDGQRRTNCPGVARGNDDGQEDERTQELNDDGQEIHRGF